MIAGGTHLASVSPVDVASGAVRVACICLAVLMMLAAAHKATTIRNGLAFSVPLLQTGWQRRHATLLLGAAGALEVVVVALLSVRPVPGLAIAFLLLVVYTAALRRLEANQPCNCMGNFLRHSREAALKRNAVLLAITGLALAATATGAVEPAPYSQATVGLALVLLAGVFGHRAVRHVTHRAGVAAEPRLKQREGRLAAQ